MILPRQLSLKFLQLVREAGQGCSIARVSLVKSLIKTGAFKQGQSDQLMDACKPFKNGKGPSEL